MNRLKKTSLILSGFILVLSLMGCNTNGPNNDEVDENITSETTDPIQEENAEPTDELQEDLEQKMDIDVMISSSDYISKIKLIKKGADATEIKILDNIKGTLSSQDLPTIEGLDINRAYIAFLEDEDGTVVLTNEKNGVILLEGDNHELFENINKQVHNN